MTTEAEVILATGDVACRVCRKPHTYRRVGLSKLATWADPVDGHSYHRMDAAEAVAARNAEIAEAVRGLEVLFDKLVDRAAVVAIENDRLKGELHDAKAEIARLVPRVATADWTGSTKRTDAERLRAALTRHHRTLHVTQEWCTDCKRAALAGGSDGD